MMQKGFTLVELMVAVSITLILLTMAVPSFNSTMMRMRASTVANSLISALNFARSEAISRNERVTLCPSSDQTNCKPAALNWDTGWLVLSANGDVLRQWSVSDSAEISLNQHNDKRIVYKPNGEVILMNGIVETETDFIFSSQIKECKDPQLNIGRQLNIELSGSLSVDPRVAGI
jgi:type IV fimbrial biogenesis protein FimT